jgi:hypothetical protein
VLANPLGQILTVLKTLPNPFKWRIDAQRIGWIAAMLTQQPTAHKERQSKGEARTTNFTTAKL